jgi:hypothetical protein
MRDTHSRIYEDKRIRIDIGTRIKKKRQRIEEERGTQIIVK